MPAGEQATSAVLPAADGRWYGVTRNAVQHYSRVRVFERAVRNTPLVGGRTDWGDPIQAVLRSDGVLAFSPRGRGVIVTDVDVTGGAQIADGTSAAGNFPVPRRVADVQFADAALRACVAAAMPGSTLLAEVRTLACANAGIRDLRGLEWFRALESLDLRGNGIGTYEPVARLPLLREPLADRTLLDTSLLADLNLRACLRGEETTETGAVAGRYRARARGPGGVELNFRLDISRLGAVRATGDARTLELIPGIGYVLPYGRVALGVGTLTFSGGTGTGVLYDGVGQPYTVTADRLALSTRAYRYEDEVVALNCDGYDIEHLDGIPALPALEGLSVRGNRITSLEPAAAVARLTMLHAAGNMADATPDFARFIAQDAQDYAHFTQREVRVPAGAGSARIPAYRKPGTGGFLGYFTASVGSDAAIVGQDYAFRHEFISWEAMDAPTKEISVPILVPPARRCGQSFNVISTTGDLPGSLAVAKHVRVVLEGDGPACHADLDRDGIVDALDLDADGDAMDDTTERLAGLDPADAADAARDADGDGASNLAELDVGADPRNPGDAPGTFRFAPAPPVRFVTPRFDGLFLSTLRVGDRVALRALLLGTIARDDAGHSFLDVAHDLPTFLPLGRTTIPLQVNDLQGRARHTSTRIELTQVRSMTFAHGFGHVAAPPGATVDIPLNLYGIQHADMHIRVHFDSRRLEWVPGVTPLAIATLDEESAVQPDSFDLDGDPTTDVLVDLHMVASERSWRPLEFGSALLLHVRARPSVDAPAVTQIRFSASAASGVLDLVSAPVHVLAGVTLDIDANGRASALKDGLLFARWLAGLRGDDLVRDALGAGARRVQPDELGLFIRNGGAAGLFDIDDTQDITLATDGQLLLRWLFGFRDVPLTRSVLGPDAFRASPAGIDAFLSRHVP